jgi:hypothetical protein
MIDPADVPPVDAGELLARFVLWERHVRRDGTVRPDVFVPHPHRDLSVTRHRSATTEEIWSIGRRVASLRAHTLRGRADAGTALFTRRGLVVAADPIAGNPNHASVSAWPPDKSQQKIIAQELAGQARFVPAPPEAPSAATI